MPADLQDEWNRAAAAGRARTRKRLLRSSAIVGACLLIAGGWFAFQWWLEVGSRKKAGAGCSSHVECQSDALCFEYLCTPGCRSGSKCDPGLACVSVELETDRGYAGKRDLCLSEAKAREIIEQQRLPSPRF